MNFQERIDKFNHMIADARRIVFFTGAGISTGSGIPDFRSADGLYNTSEEADPEYMLSADCLYKEPARIRMATLYMVAAAIGGRVCNTGNASEFYIGYTTKYGDLAGDFALFRHLTVREIYAIGDYLTELPPHLVHKAPADGMSGKTDEDNTGIPYDAVDDFLLDSIIPEMTIWEKMVAAHERNIHKAVINLPAPRRAGYSLNYHHPGGAFEVF